MKDEQVSLELVPSKIVEAAFTNFFLYYNDICYIGNPAFWKFLNTPFQITSNRYFMHPEAARKCFLLSSPYGQTLLKMHELNKRSKAQNRCLKT